MKNKTNLLAIVSLVFSISAFGVTVDGKIDDEWKNAIVYELNYEINPSLNGKANLKTTAYIQYDADNLYIGFKVFGDPSKLRGTFRARDTAFNEDFVALILDPFNDNRVSLGIGVSSMGSQLDWKHISDREEDANWNILFFSKTQITDFGYTAELKIPFSELQFQEAPITKFRIGFTRKSFENGTATLFSDFTKDPSINCTFCMANKVLELVNIKNKKRNYIYPYFTANQSGDRQFGEFKSDNPNIEFGVSGLYDISSSSFIEYTVNPDFSQVEAEIGRAHV